ncbi:Asparagine synthetase [glutamine-hydrolyzing] 1, partial [Durusdinium trenchii]
MSRLDSRADHRHDRRRSRGRSAAPRRADSDSLVADGVPTDEMCGIAGACWTPDGDPVSPETLKRMTGALRHRGPDDEGFFHSGDSDGNPHRVACGLGHRRLSIIVLSGGHQPLSNEDGTVWIAFNGEIYNYRELRPALEAAGHRFTTETDTEVIVHLYEEHGPECVSFLRGMFAFAIWDARRGEIFLARDRLGQKPLFYRAESHRLTFASELKALLQVPGAPREIDPTAIDLFLTYQYVPHPRSILYGYAKLPPAHWALFDGSTLKVQRYWSPPYSFRDTPALADESLRESESWSPQHWQQQLREALTEAVRLRMRSDVPLGAFLSGGIDSTIIAGLMQQLSDKPIHTFSIGFPIAEFDERSYAREAARHLGTNHHEYLVEPSALAMRPRLIWQYDEPFGDSSAVPTMYLSEVTRREVTVFGWPIWKRLPGATRRGSIVRRATRFGAAIARSPELRYLRWIGIFDDEARHDLYSDSFRERIADHDASWFIQEAYAACPDRDFVTRTTCADVLSYLPCDILTKVDIASMTYGLEARSPFLDLHVAELAARMPIDLKIQGAKGKRVLIDTFRDLLPESIQNRGKMGFGVPIDHWFRDELRSLLEETLLDERTFERGYFRPESLRRLVDEHVSGTQDHAYRLWNLVCLEQWTAVLKGPPLRTPKESHHMPALGSLRLTGFLSAIVTLCLIGPVATAAEPMTTDVFVSGVDGYHTYRIPGLVVSNEGTLLAFCEGRRNDRRDHGDIDMLLKRSTDGGRTWSKAILVYEEGGTESVTIGNPCPVVDRTTGTIWLPFCRDNDRVFVTSSDDDGLTWTPPREITATVKANNWDWYATGPGHGIQLQYGPHKGRLVIPCDCREKLKDGSWDKRGRSLVIYSDDQGQTWKRGQATELGMNECEVVERRDGTLLLSMRNYLGKNL